MKRAFVLLALLFLLALFGFLLILRPLHKQTVPLLLPLSLTMPTTTNVGAALTIIAHTQANTSVSFTLFNGIQRLVKTLNSDGDGAATWEIPADTVISAGDSLLIARTLTDTVQRGLHVLPGEVTQLDFLTTANNLTAYGESQTMLIALAGDRYGNPVSNANLALKAQFPGANPQISTLSTEAGLGWTWLRSAGTPGRVRLALSDGSIEQRLELAQMPSAPASVSLKLVPACVPNDGRSVITLQAQVADEHGSPIANSTMVQFEWYQGSGSAQVFNGTALLRVPAPSAAGRYSFRGIQWQRSFAARSASGAGRGLHLSKPQLKFAFFLVGAAILIPLAFVGFSLLSQFITEFNRGASPASIFHGNSLFIPTAEQAQWLPNPPNYNSLLPSQAEREEIIGTYWEAWEALARACVTRDPSALPTYWAGGAFQQVQPIIQCEKGTTLAHLGHGLRLQFFSDDGTVVRFSDQGFHFTYAASGTTTDLPADAAITMTLDTGVWRVRQLEITLHP